MDTASNTIVGKRLLSRSEGGSSAEIAVDVTTGEILQFWCRATGDTADAPKVALDGDPVLDASAALSATYRFFELNMPSSGRLSIAFDPRQTLVPVAYLFHPDAVLKTGIDILHVHEQTATPEVPGTIHFWPPFGWMNDPNGMVFHDGRHHLCYQHYPHVPQWNLMHWGHAVSDDLLHWRHLPILVRPDPDVFPEDDRSGGAYSGSAISRPNGIRLYYTDRKLHRQPEDQFQRTALSLDGITIEPAKDVVPRRPDLPGLTSDFRDPYVFEGPDGRLKMIVGSKDAEGGVVLLFETEEPEGDAGWRFAGMLHKQTESPRSVCECPCMIDLGSGLWALIYGMLSSTDPATGKRNISTALVGAFDGQKFEPRHSQELDFGSDAYAFQATPTPDGPVGIAWLANWASLIKTTRTHTAMTLPRQVVWDGERLCLPPVPSIDALRAAPLPTEGFLRGETLPVRGPVELDIALPVPGAELRLIFGHPVLGLGLALGPDGLEILHDDASEKQPRYIAFGAAPSRLRIVLDHGSIEVFADAGRWVGTKRLASLAPITDIRLEAGAPSGAAIYELSL